jgi:hypothetical protein
MRAPTSEKEAGRIGGDFLFNLNNGIREEEGE